MEYHLKSISEVAQHLKTSTRGLSKEEAHQRLEQHGKNVLIDFNLPCRSSHS